MLTLTGDEENFLRKVRLFCQSSYQNLLRLPAISEFPWELRVAAILTFAKAHHDSWDEPATDSLSDWLNANGPSGQRLMGEIAHWPVSTRLLIADWITRSAAPPGQDANPSLAREAARLVEEIISAIQGSLSESRTQSPTTTDATMVLTDKPTLDSWVDSNALRIAWFSTAESASRFHSRNTCKLLIVGRTEYRMRNPYDRVKSVRRIASAPIQNLVRQGFLPCRYCFAGEFIA